MHRLRALTVLALWLGLALASAGVTVAAARGQVMAGGEIVLCTGDGPVTVRVDAGDGGPVLHICPDMAPLLLSGVATAPVAAVTSPAVGLSEAGHRPVMLPVPGRTIGAAQPRGPPVGA
jgi:hypothetical protein